jgi:hypothetical protein
VQGVLLMVSGILLCLIAAILVLRVETGQRSLEDFFEPESHLSTTQLAGH